MRLAHIALAVDVEEAGRCSTPFGIYEVGTRVALTKHPSNGLMCSTPFGIYEVGTSSTTWLAKLIFKCSTPFGIYEVGTTRTEQNATLASSAQRLSASMRLARQRATSSPVASVKCSTPFGIYEVGTA